MSEMIRQFCNHRISARSTFWSNSNVNDIDYSCKEQWLADLDRRKGLGCKTEKD